MNEKNINEPPTTPKPKEAPKPQKPITLASQEAARAEVLKAVNPTLFEVASLGSMAVYVKDLLTVLDAAGVDVGLDRIRIESVLQGAQPLLDRLGERTLIATSRFGREGGR